MRILIVDDHAIVREGLGRLLSKSGEHQFREAIDGREALSSVGTFQPDLVILDLDLPGLGGVELLRRLILDGTGRILVLTMHAETLHVRRALEAGAHGYLSKNASPAEILLAVQKVAAGGRYVEAEIAQSLVLDDGSEKGALEALSPRQIEILRLLSSGSSLNEIAAALGVNYKTVANNCTLIKGKLGVGRTADLVRLALASGLS